MRRQKHQQRALGQLLTVVAGFLFCGVILLLHVWLPIQAQRSLSELKKWEKQLSEQKYFLRNLELKYIEKTGLASLDQWAKKNGPWKIPKAGEIVTIYD